MKKIIAIVPIRKGSQRVKNKNFRPFAKKNLLAYKIETLKKIDFFDDIIINTDSDEAIAISKELNVNHVKREPYFASSECPNSDFWKHIAETTQSEYIVFTNCTSPLIKLDTYKKLGELYETHLLSNKFDSINTVTEIREFLFLNNKPLNFQINKTPNSQDLPDVVKLNFAVNILKTEIMNSQRSLLGNKPYLFKLDEIEGFDINTEFEFSYAEQLFKNFNNG